MNAQRTTRPYLWLVLIAACMCAPASADDSSSTQEVNAFSRNAYSYGTVFNIAHAGASSLAPQNTMAAAQKALDAGADVWGIDVRLTADGAFVLMHDDTLDRTTNVEDVFPARDPWRVADFTWEEIQSLDAGSWFVQEDPFAQIEEGNVSAADQAAYIGEPIPSLRQALAFVAAHEWLIDIEVKPLDTAVRAPVAESLVNLIRETGTKNRILVSSFDHEFLREVKAIDPTLIIGALSIFAPLNAAETLDAMGVDVYLPSLVGFNADLLEQLADRKIHVFVWTYNTLSQLEYVIGFVGITGIYTDFPQRLAVMLGERKETEAP